MKTLLSLIILIITISLIPDILTAQPDLPAPPDQSPIPMWPLVIIAAFLAGFVKRRRK